MLIYADHKKECRTTDIIRGLLELTKESGILSSSDHLKKTELLIKFGEFEAALTDKLCAKEDTVSPLLMKLRNAALLTGYIYRNSSSEGIILHEKISGRLNEISCFKLPEKITLSLPEGYAYYGLYPEMYVEATTRFFQRRSPKKIFVIGIRSIGTSLSAVVASSLEAYGCNVKSFTIRPRGDYFNRHVNISDELKNILLKDNPEETYFLIVDEGPGLSGTSFCSIAEYLTGLGVADDKIIFFPSWEPDSNDFVSDVSKKVWLKHEKYTVSFEDSVLNSRQFLSCFQCRRVIDISAGKWRKHFFKDESKWPAVYQNLEQRKYICKDDLGKQFFLKFAGLGHYGLNLFNRAVKLSEAGFSPKAYDISYGFIKFDFVEGVPLRKEEITEKLLDRFIDYLLFLKNNFPCKPSISLKELKEMIRINILKGIGEEWIKKIEGIERDIVPNFEKYSTAIDGRMLPHEWLRTKEGLIKTDSIHHHNDHLLPGAIDIAWDIAGTIVEFRLQGKYQDYFLSRYILTSGDRHIKERLNLYLIAYLAFRIGYTKFSFERLAQSSDGLKFQNLFKYYSSYLKDIL